MYRLQSGLALTALLSVCFSGGSFAQEPAKNTPPGTPDAESVHPVWENYRAEFHRYICPFRGEAAYDQEAVECGYVLVPEDRTHPQSRLIAISIMRIRSTSETPPGGAILRLDGGPGGPGLSGFRAQYYTSPQAAKFRKAFDLIFFDQRGIGYSEAAFCRALPESFQRGMNTSEGEAAYLNAMRRCLSEAKARGIAVDAYNTWQNALDTRDIRRALGYDRWNIYGISYGTQLGQAVLQVDREGIRAAVLDSVVPALPENASEMSSALGFRSALTAIDRMCADHPACARDIGTLSERIVTIIRSFGKEPLVIEGADRDRFRNGRIVVDDSLAASAVFQLLYNRALYGDLPIILRALERRDSESLRRYAESLATPINHKLGKGMGLVTRCRSGSISAWPAHQAEAAASEPEFFRWFANTAGSYAKRCAALYRIDPDPSVKRLVTDLPILVAAGSADPITPAGNAKAILPGLKNATYVEFPYTGHGATRSHPDCGFDLLIAFLKSPDKPLDTACVDRIKPPSFVTRFRETSAPIRFVSGVREGSVLPVLPTLTIAGLLIAFLTYPLTFAGRLADRNLETRGGGGLGSARLATWVAAAGSLAALGTAAWLTHQWIRQHPLGLPMGLPSAIAWAGYLGAGAVLIALAGLVLTMRRRRKGEIPLGTLLGAGLVTLLSVLTLYLLFSIGAGPL